jgi:DNA-binding CsgD family transcriptional regulator/PAS domain-containing protein
MKVHGRMTTDHDSLLRQTYEAVGDPSRWDGLLGCWADALEADSGLLFSPGDQFNSQPMHGHRYDFDTAKSYGEYYHQHDVWTHAGRQQGFFEPGRVGCGEMLAPQDSLRKSLFYNDFLRHMEQEWLLCTVLSAAGNTLQVPDTVLSFYRRPGRRAFGRDAVAALQRAVPHLQRCLALHHELLRARSDRSLFESGLDQIGIGMLLLGNDGRVQFANRRAELMLRSGTGQTPALLPALQQLDRLARQGQYQGRRLAGGQGSLYAMATPNHRSVAKALRGHGDGAVIWLIDTQRGGGSLALAASLFGLTPAEQRVLSLLLEDQAPKQIASTLGIGVSTVRTQLSSLLQKTGTRRQQDLMRLMAAFPQG